MQQADDDALEPSLWLRCAGVAGHLQSLDLASTAHSQTQRSHGRPRTAIARSVPALDRACNGPPASTTCWTGSGCSPSPGAPNAHSMPNKGHRTSDHLLISRASPVHRGSRPPTVGYGGRCGSNSDGDGGDDMASCFRPLLVSSTSIEKLCWIYSRTAGASLPSNRHRSMPPSSRLHGSSPCSTHPTNVAGATP